MVKRLIYLVLFVVVFNFVEHFAHKKTDGFSLHRIQFSTPGLPKLPPLYLPELHQPYHYLGCGNQCYAFLSQDGRYVLKFFKYAHPPIPPFLTHIPILNCFKPFRRHRLEKMLWKQKRDFQGYQLAYTLFREETGLIALHLHPEGAKFPTLTLTDKIHCVLTVDLSQTPFVLQRRAVPTYQQLRAWMAAGQIEEAQQALASLIRLLEKRISLGLQDDDVHFYSNFGFIGQQAIQIDPGHFTPGASCTCPELEIKAVTEELRTWCEKHAPALLAQIPS